MIKNERTKLEEDLFQAYFDARKNKRKSLGSLRFEMNFEQEIFLLCDELLSRKYEISPSICFVSFFPVKREIFAGSFRDRVVHHLVYNYINPICENYFINDNYSCRKNKGTSYGTKRAEHFIRSCSENYKKDCYILKLDISGYFMSINKKILFQKVCALILKSKKPKNFDLNLIFWLIEKIIFNDPTKNCLTRGTREDWQGMPKNKSLFYAQKDCGLPIGNLTSQLFGNVYLDEFDHFIKQKIKCRYYGRYVDDMLFIHQDRNFLKKIPEIVDDYLNERLNLKLHRKKIYLQHFFKGVVFLGKVLKPHRIYLKNKNKGSFYKKIKYWKKLKKERNLSQNEKKKIYSSFLSYLGLISKCNAFKLKLKITRKIRKEFGLFSLLFFNSDIC